MTDSCVQSTLQICQRNEWTTTKKNCDLHVLTIEIKSSVILSLYYSVVLRKFSHSKTMASFIQLIHGSFFLDSRIDWIVTFNEILDCLHIRQFFGNIFFFMLSKLCQSRKKTILALIWDVTFDLLLTDSLYFLLKNWNIISRHQINQQKIDGGQ